MENNSIQAQSELNPLHPVLLPEYFTVDAKIKELKEGDFFKYNSDYFVVLSNTRFDSNNQFAKEDSSPLYLECIRIPSGKKILGTLELRVKRIEPGLQARIRHGLVKPPTDI